VLAVRSTHIYCRPSCPARRPLRRNVTFFRTREEAETQCYRPSLRCRPNEISGPVALVQRAAGHLAASSEEGVRLGGLARTLGTTQGTLRRAFLQVTGLKPRELAEALRIKRFKAMLRAGQSIADALYETGYGSSSRVYERSNAHLGMPKAVRAVARACATNPVSIVVPCHRVIREDGTMAGYRWGLARKEQLLAQERSVGD